MGIGTSIFLIAVGAILAFAIHVTGNTHGVDVNTIGWILMIVGAVGAVLSVAFWSSWGAGGMHRTRTVYRQPDQTVVEDRREF